MFFQKFKDLFSITYSFHMIVYVCFLYSSINVESLIGQLYLFQSFSYRTSCQMIRYNSNKSLQKFRYQSCFSLFVLNLTWKKFWIKLMFSQFQAFPILWMLPWAPRVDENSRYEKAKIKIFFIRCNAAAIFSFQPFLQFFVICSVFSKDSLRYKWFRSNQICVSVIQDIFQWKITFLLCVP